MSAPSLRRVMSPEMRTALYYLTFFTTAGGAGAYFAIWLSDKGISAGDIGWINSVPIFIILVLNMFVGRIADRASDWRGVIVVGSVISGVMTIGLFFADGFWPILVVWALSNVPQGLVAPVIDAAAMRMTRRKGTDFATVRAWGTVGYMVSLAVMGLMAGWLGGWIFVPLMVFFALSRGLLALGLPRFRAPEEATPVPGVVAARRIGQVMKPWFVLPVLAFALVQGTHVVLNVFAALVWKQAGVEEVWIGPLLALGGFSEAVIMFVFIRFSSRFTARHLILVSAAVAAVRWALMAFNPPLWALAGLQLLHGVTFGFGYLGVVNFIANWTSEDVAAEAQGFAVMTQLSLTVVALSGFGYLVDLFNAGAFMAASAFSLAAVLMVWASLMMVMPKADTQD